ncbi:MAG: methylated-DNA--[protein]-cysteine S-methyltransferase [Fidelibacterota bacterium]|nr:MAG: methylated-DNA--[protein]-cysteine S-methyltransferase [Candidatus Neomarinimicrobiota bacterium]
MLTYDSFNTNIGLLTVVKSERGVCFIGLPSATMSRVQIWANRRFPGEALHPASAPFGRERQELQEYTSGGRTIFTFSLDHRNTPFSLQVLEEVCRVPYGETASYADIARRVARPHAARAVGRAVAANPLPLVIPCHRIVGSNGSLTGFGGGLNLKQELLLLESHGA